MPKVWYPFPPEHEYAGRYYEGWAPDGALDDLQKSGGFVFERPSDSKVVQPIEIIKHELAMALDEFSDVSSDLESVGKPSLIAKFKRSVESNKTQINNVIEDGNVARARLLLDSIERDTEEMKKLLGNMIPWMGSFAGQAPQVEQAKKG